MYRRVLCFVAMAALCVLSCRSSADSRASVQLAQVSQAMWQGAFIGSKLYYNSAYHEREPNPNAQVGALLYERYCASCHSNRKGPPLVGTYNTTPENESDYYVIYYGLNANSAEKSLDQMRGFSSRLTKFQIFDILAYLQSAYAKAHDEDQAGGAK